MQCPVCSNVQLVMSERQGIEIDYCPSCRGVWLDRGELDKIIERSVPDKGGKKHSDSSKYDDFNSGHRPSYSRDNDHKRDHYHGEHGHDKKKKRGGFLDDLFDF